MRYVVERLIIKQDGDDFVKAFNKAARGKMSVTLVGSLVYQGFSAKDIDVVLNILDEDWFDGYEGMDEPPHHKFMRKAGAHFLDSTYGYETEEWLWDGMLIDMQFGEYE